MSPPLLECPTPRPTLVPAQRSREPRPIVLQTVCNGFAQASRKAAPPAGASLTARPDKGANKPSFSPDRLFHHQDRAIAGRPVMPADAATERARLLKEAVGRALSVTRHMSQLSPGRNRIIFDIAAAYNGRTLSGGRRLKLRLSTLKLFMGFVRRGGGGAWRFLKLHYPHHHGPRERIVRGPSSVDVGWVIDWVDKLPGQRKDRAWQQVRAAILLLACMGIEAREKRYGITAACKTASAQYYGADLGEGRKLAFSLSVSFRNYRKYRAAQRSIDAFRLYVRRPVLRMPPGLSIRRLESSELN